ncbi:MAG: bifunctional diguanylate cyclase/phosphodiesterase [Pleomorphochaeta sp.]
MPQNSVNKLTRKDLSIIIKKTLFFVIPFTILYIIFFSYLFSIKKTNSINLLIKDTEQVATKIDILVDYFQREITEDLMVIKESNEFNYYLNNTNNHSKENLAQLFFRLAKSKPNFTQIRFIDKDGYEQVRVNNNNGNIEIVTEDKLQYKGDRYYVINSTELKDGEFYFSPLDLNIENGEVEIPYKPLFRISTPIYKNNQYFGSIIINHLASNILDIIDENVTRKETPFIDDYLVNEDGYYLYNEDETKLFSYMFDDHNYNIKDLIPNFDAEKDLNKPFVEDNILYTISNISSENNENALSFYLIQTFDINNLDFMKNIVIFNLNIVEFIMLIFIDLLAFCFVVFLVYRNKDKEQIALTSLIANNTNDGIVITDKKTNIIFVNKAYEKITGYEKSEIIGKKTSYFKSGLHQNSFYKKMWNSLNNNKVWFGELWDKKKNGLLYPKQLKIYAFENKYTDSVQKYVGIFSDLTKEKESETNLRKIKNYNFETNLPNQNLLFKLIKTQINKPETKMFGIFCFSIVNFDSVTLNKDKNDINKILTQFIKDIQKLIDKKDFLAQISRDTFVVGILSYDTKDEINNFITNFFHKINEKSFYQNYVDVFFNIKGGASIYPEDGQNADDLLNSSKMALESAKDQNKSLVFSSIKVRDNIKKQYLMSLYLKDAIINNELFVTYQPQVDNINKQIIGAEALIRWNNPTLGLISPFLFIPIAEKNGFIIDIGYWIIEEVFKDFNEIKDTLPSNFKLSINISPIQFNDDNIINKIIELSDKYNIDLSYFELEITENVLVSDIENVNSKLTQFKDLGLSIAMDDFGTGFSSLSYLQNLLIDKIKIDRSFIKDYPENDTGTVAKIIVKIAKELELKLITEGVETKEQLNYMNSIGCYSIQGYYFSKPLLLSQLKEYIKKFQETHTQTNL